jgi:hypothetical protein
MIYKNYQRNHVILPGRAQALDDFLNAKPFGTKHKLKHAYNSNSEDALTWSCFDILRNLPHDKMIVALDEILEDSFTIKPFSFADEKNIDIHIGKWYGGAGVGDCSELDTSIETEDKLIFIEAKLYGAIQMPGKRYPYDQIIKKMRIGLDTANRENRRFYFIFLDIAPPDKLLSIQGGGDFAQKRENAYRFNLYRTDPKVLQNNLQGIKIPDSFNSKKNMGWLTWACLFKTTLRSVINSFEISEI